MAPWWLSGSFVLGALYLRSVTAGVRSSALWGGGGACHSFLPLMCRAVGGRLWRATESSHGLPEAGYFARMCASRQADFPINLGEMEGSEVRLRSEGEGGTVGRWP